MMTMDTRTGVTRTGSPTRRGLALLVSVVVAGTALGTASTAATPAHAASNVQIGPAELIATDAELPIIYDGSMATLRTSTDTLTYFHTTLDTTTRFDGSSHQPLSQQLPNAIVDDGGRTGNAWLVNLYKHSDGSLLGFSHYETCTSCPSGHFYIGLMRSTDAGASWRYLGDILAPQENGLGEQSNIGGVPYLVVGDYFLVYFNEHINGVKRLSVARAPVADVLTAAAAGNVTQWRKYRDGSWDEDGLTGVGSNIIPNGETAEADHNTSPDLHSDAAYLPSLGKYVITVHTHSQGKLLLYTSTDGLSWGEETVIDDTGPGGRIQAYSFFVGVLDASDDGRELGSDFYVYFPRKNWPDAYGDDELYRRRITIGGDTANYVASASFGPTQGFNQWSYQETAADGSGAYPDMSWDPATSRWKGTPTFTLVGKDWQHPDSTHSVRAWTATFPGTVRVYGTAKKRDASCGDGVSVHITRNGDTIWPSTPANIAHDDVVGVGHDLSVVVATGDVLRFTVTQGGSGNNACDTTRWDPTVVYQ